MAAGQDVLVVDGLSETEVVLKAVLEPRGLRVNRIRRHAEDGLPTARPRFDVPQDATPTRVVVIHANDADGEHSVGESWNRVPQVVIGPAKLDSNCASDRPSGSHYLEKPFQYSELIQAIERLLDESRD